MWRAMGELWATIARHIFTTLTLTMACGTVYAPLELSICTTMSMNGNAPPFTPMTLILKVGLFAKMSFSQGRRGGAYTVPPPQVQKSDHRSNIQIRGRWGIQ